MPSVVVPAKKIYSLNFSAFHCILNSVRDPTRRNVGLAQPLLFQNELLNKFNHLI